MIGDLPLVPGKATTSEANSSKQRLCNDWYHDTLFHHASYLAMDHANVSYESRKVEGTDLQHWL